MLSSKLEKALNDQINAELWSSYLYLSMSAHFAEAGLAGFAKWFRKQAGEEVKHAMKIFDYIVARGSKVALQPIEKVTQSWKSPLAAFEDTLKHEKEVTQMIHNLVELTEDEKDYATRSMLQWFVDEQVEEEETPKGIIDQLKLIDGNSAGIYSLDKDLSNRKD